MKSKAAVVLLALAALASVAGCGGGSAGALNPRFQPEVANTPDSFQFQSTGVTRVTQTLTYQWQNSGTVATINQATVVSGGTAILSLADSTGKPVYSADLKNNGTFESIPGTAGTWTVTLGLNNFSGTLNFRVQKKP